MKKKMLVTAALSGMILSISALLWLTELASANPYIAYRQVPAPVKPIITFLSPSENNTLQKSSTLNIAVKALIESISRFELSNRPGSGLIYSTNANALIKKVYYETSWQPNNVTVYEYNYNDLWNPNDDDPNLTEYLCNLSLSGVPEGNQTLTITVYETGSYSRNMILYSFYAYSHCTLGFTVDTVPPQVTVLELDEKTFFDPDVLVNFTVNESVSEMQYSLDGQEHVSIAGNTTLPNLSFGEHNITVYATDEAGNIGKSETISFTITEPFPTTLVASASAVSVVVFAVFLAYQRKHKH